MRTRMTLAMVVVMTAAACGGGAPSKEEFTEKANPPCQTANTELAGVTKPADLRQMGDVAGKVAGSTETQVKTIGDLEQPDDNKPELERMLTGMRSTASAGRAVEGGAQRGDLRATEKGVTDLKLASEQADDAARTYGLADCGKGARAASTLIAEASGDVLKREVITKADALCKEANRKLEAQSEPESLDELVKLLDETIGIAEKLVGDLRAIAVPDSMKAAYDDAMASNDRLLVLLRDSRAAAKAGNERRAEQLFDQLDTATAESNKKADAFGFKDCGSDA